MRDWANLKNQLETYLEQVRIKLSGAVQIAGLWQKATDAADIAAVDMGRCVSVDTESSANSVPTAISLEFEEGLSGKQPLGWTALASTSPDHYSVQTTKSGCRTGPLCVVVSGSPGLLPNAIFNLMRTAETMTRAGRQFRLRAWVKLDAYVEVHGSNVDPHGRPRPQSYFLRYRGFSGARLRLDPA